MYRCFISIALLLSVGSYSQAYERMKPEWARTGSFRALSASDQTRILVQYEEQVDQMADMFRSYAPAPLSVEKDQAIVDTARCVTDDVMALAIRQDLVLNKPTEADFKRSYVRCAEKQTARLRTAELRAKADESRAAARMNVFDYLLDYRQNLGNKVAVKGSLIQRADLTLLHPPGRPDAFLLVDTTALSRDERKRILLSCASGCEIEVYGQVKDIAGQKGLSAIALR
jgi:hypothetical protein